MGSLEEREDSELGTRFRLVDQAILDTQFGVTDAERPRAGIAVERSRGDHQVQLNVGNGSPVELERRSEVERAHARGVAGRKQICLVVLEIHGLGIVGLERRACMQVADHPGKADDEERGSTHLPMLARANPIQFQRIIAEGASIPSLKWSPSFMPYLEIASEGDKLAPALLVRLRTAGVLVAMLVKTLLYLPFSEICDIVKQILHEYPSKRGRQHEG